MPLISFTHGQPPFCKVKKQLQDKVSIYAVESEQNRSDHDIPSYASKQPLIYAKRRASTRIKELQVQQSWSQGAYKQGTNRTPYYEPHPSSDKFIKKFILYFPVNFQLPLDSQCQSPRKSIHQTMMLMRATRVALGHHSVTVVIHTLAHAHTHASVTW